MLSWKEAPCDAIQSPDELRAYVNFRSDLILGITGHAV